MKKVEFNKGTIYPSFSKTNSHCVASNPYAKPGVYGNTPPHSRFAAKSSSPSA
jgi:hypothetical protein